MFNEEDVVVTVRVPTELPPALVGDGGGGDGGAGFSGEVPDGDVR